MASQGLRQVRAVTGWRPAAMAGMSGPSAALVVAGVLVGAVLAGVAAARLSPQMSLGMVGGVALLVVSLRWPLVPLFVFVALVPIEDIVLVEGIGTLSRLVGVLFAVVYV